MQLPFTLLNLAHALLIIVIFIIAGKLLTLLAQKYIIKWAEKTSTQLDDILISKIKPPFSYIIWFIGIQYALKPLHLHYAVVENILNTLVLFIAVYIVAVFADIIIKNFLERLTKKTDSTLDDALLPLMSKTLSAIIILIGIMWALRIWRVDISPLLTSLGIAGLALSFAVKDSLANVFGGISMILDKTIKVGDKIKVESGIIGIVVDMGLRSTKLKTFDNELIIIPNGKLANSQIQNFVQPTPPQRVNVHFSVGYDSNVDAVRKVVKDTLMQLNGIDATERLPEVLFVSMEDFYLKFTARFWVAHYNDAKDKEIEAIGRIFAALKQHNITIPYPTQTLYIKKEK